MKQIFLGLMVFFLLFLFLGWFFASKKDENPWKKMPVYAEHQDHSSFFQQNFSDGPAVTTACLSCHPKSGEEVLETSHWTWLGEFSDLPGQKQPLQMGKKNVVNNFCIGIQSNWAHCTSCHAGYGWVDSKFDFKKKENVDCLVCHDQSKTYKKTFGGLPAEGIDLLVVAKSVGLPTRNNCGDCHFKGGGGDAVKHGDLDGTMFQPPEHLDVHMGKYNFQCIDCHRTQHHQIAGRSMSVSVTDQNRIRCTDCHSQAPHQEMRLNTHTKSVACQSCHIPKMAVEAATKMSWDWSEAGQDLPSEDSHLYNKKKGRFTFAQNINPEYYWYNGKATRYLLGDKINPAEEISINTPLGNIQEARAQIWPFKVHRGKQIYDRENLYLLVPKTYGKGGYWTEFNWDLAAKLGSEASGLKYSGHYGFVETKMYWPLSHMVAPKEKALQCTDCHEDDSRLNWNALGYAKDPAFGGGRVPFEGVKKEDKK